MIGQAQEYKGFVLHRMKPSKKIIVRILKDGQYKQTCNNLINAKRLVDFCLKYGVWE